MPGTEPPQGYSKNPLDILQSNRLHETMGWLSGAHRNPHRPPEPWQVLTVMLFGPLIIVAIIVWLW